ncbi:MAG: MG2 domain-containing protein [Candidatus Azobacteroides sp.]|nr:MG2 domain-containing protein [Candidatus Azobacteroides sp.]
MKRKLCSLFLILLLGLCCFSCKNNKEIAPSVDFAPYISAYTGGTVSSQSPIRIQLTQNVSVVELNAEIKEKLFSFTPSLKGKTYWTSNNTIEFMPDSGQLKPGTLYNGEFKLGKVMKVDKKASIFPFSFHVVPQDFSIESADYFVSSENLKVAKVSGKIKFSDVVSLEDVKKMVSFNMEGDNSFTTKIEQGDNNKMYLFTVENIKRTDSDRDLFIKITGKPIKTDKEIQESVLIPGLSSFKVISAEIIEDPESGVKIVFSEPVSTKQNLKGLIELPEASSYVFQVKDNHVNVFFEKNNLTMVTVNIDKGVKNSEGRALKSGATFSLEIKSSNPKIELTGSGIILPDSKNLIFPFKSVNLAAVDLRIIRIFESNVLMFLQANKLNTSEELRRSGRLIYKKTLRLDKDPTKKLNRWNDFSIDLSEIIKQEPGAIYRIELSFKREYSVYSCDGNGDVADAGLSSITPIESNEDEDEIWDKPQSYYWSSDDYDWDEYSWEDVDNPCKPSYYMSSENTKVACNVLASNLGLIVKGNADKKLWVAVNDILTTNPISGAEIKVYNYQLQEIGSGKTDGDGFAVLDLKGKPFVLKASSGQQLGYLRLVDGEENSLSRFDVGGKETQKGLKGYVFGERGVWRPGDTLHISFILEDRTKKIPQNHPVTLEMYNPKGQFYTKLVSTNGMNGFYTFNIPTDPNDLTGFWNAYVKVGGASFHKSLRIETIKPNRLKINLEIPGNKINSSGNNPLTLSSYWLTGATARNLKASVEMSLSKVNTQFKGYEKYNFNNPATSFNFDKIEVFKGNLNDDGTVKFTFNAPEASDAPGMLQATFTSRVFEPGGDVSTYMQSAPYSPFSSYVGINVNQKDSRSYFETDVTHTFDVVTLNSEGKPVNRENLDYRVYKLSWSWWWENNSNSLDNYVNNTSTKPVLSEKINTINGKATVRFKIDYPEWGRYLVYIKDKQSGHATGQIVYVDWPESRGRAQKKDPEGLTMLSFTTDKESYEVGEDITVTIPQSAGGRALVALENGTSVLNRTWVEISDKNDTKYTFKVTEEMAPNFYIHISLLQPHAQTVNSLPIRMYGVMPVLVNNKNSMLEPQIKMPDSLQPEKEFTVNVSEKSGKPMTYTLAIVDDGLLDLTAFKTPNPWNEFYAREAIGIKTWDMYDFVIGAFTGKFAGMFAVGGDQSLKQEDAKAKRFKPVVKFIGPFALKKGETKSHQLQLPMYVGSVRTMVVAAQDGAYGNAEKTVPVKNPLMILPTLPRVVSVGEEITLPVNVFAMETDVKDVNVKVETEGLTQVDGKSSQSIKFSKIGDEMVYFTLKVGDKTGVEKIKVSASGNGNKAEDVIEIQVRNPNPPIITNVNKLLSASQEETFDYNLLDNSNESWVKMEISRIPSVDLNRRFDYLMSYEHCCTEQLVSKAFPLLYIGEFKNLTEKELEMTKSNVREAIRLLYGRQYPNGGFMYWPGYEYSNPWISSYAGQFLLEASKKGYDVNQGVINRWLAFQRKAAQAGDYESNRYSYYQYDLQQAYCLYSLALAGNPEMGAMNRLKERKSLSPQAAWRLAAAYALCGKTNISNELAFNVRTSIDPYSSDNSSYGSSNRDEAMILESLVLMGNMQKAYEQAKKVSQNLSTQYYFDTQTTAYSLLAMGKLAEKSPKGMIEFDWSLNGKSNPEVKTAKAIYQMDIPANKPQGNVKVKNISQGDLFITLTSKSKPLNDTLPAISQNIKVEVTYTDMNGNSIGVENIKQGTDFKAIVRVSNISGNNDYKDLALTHIFPSGWEIFNERMELQDGESVEKKSYTYRDIRDDRVFTYFELMRGQSKTFTIRLQAAYAGKFTLPAVQCESMYDTQTHAKTKAGKVEVSR